MSDIVSFGKLLSLCCIVDIYILGWMITVDCLKNDNGFLPARIIAYLYIIFHGIALILYMILSWIV